MSETPRVDISSDNLEKNQWGLDFFRSRDGNKYSLDAQRVGWGIGGVFVLLGILPFFFDTNSTAVSGYDSAITIPLTLASAQVIPVAPIASSLDPEPTQTHVGRRLGKANSRFTGPQLISRPRNLKAIPPGTMIKAILMSGASNGLARVETKEPVSQNGDVLIESGSVLLGSGNSTEDRLLVRFDQVVFKDGSFGQINAQACDRSDKIVGLKGSKLGNKALNIAGAVGLGFLGGFSEGLQDSRGEAGTVVKQSTMKNALLNGTSTAALEQSKNLMSNLKNRSPVIEVPAGTEICVLFGVNQ